MLRQRSTSCGGPSRRWSPPSAAARSTTRPTAALVEAQVAAGSHGVLVNGTTGEPSLLTVDERNRLVDVAMEAAGRTAAGRRRHRLAVAARVPPADRARRGGGRRRRARRDAVLRAPAAAGHRRLLRPGRGRPGDALARVPHPRSGGRRGHGRHAGAAPRRVADVRRDEARRQRPRARVRRAGPARPGLPGVRRPRGAELPDDGGRGLRADERGRQRGAGPAGRDLRGRPRRRPPPRPQAPREPLRAERGRLLRHQPHPGQVHDEADRAPRRQRAPAADGAGDARGGGPRSTPCSTGPGCCRHR